MVRSSFAIIVVLSTGCIVGDAGVEPPAGENIDEPPPPTSTMTGRILDDFTGKPLGGAVLETLGLEDEQRSFSDGQGAYMLKELPEASVFLLHASKDNYADMHDDSATVDSAQVQHDVRLMSRGDTERQYATLGLAMRETSATVVVEIVGPDGAPVAGFARDAIALRDASGASETLPVVFGALGDVDPTLGTTVIANGRSRAAFLDVPEGVFDLVITTAQSELHRTIAARAGSVTLTKVQLVASVPPLDATFADVYRILQRGSDGGSGCANCHTPTGAQPALVFDGTQDDVFAALRNRPGVIDTARPAASLLLTKPLYELPANHPNATWLDTNHHDYLIIKTWIEAGAGR